MKKKQKKKVLIFGAGGMLGKECKRQLSNSAMWYVIGLSERDIDITNYDSLFCAIKKIRPDVVINCAALINIDDCEKDPLRAWMVNAIGPGYIVRALKEAGRRRTVFVHISTSDVFGGRKPRWKEKNIPSPVNAYGWSKLYGEKNIEHEARGSGIRYYIIRTSWLYSEYRPTFIDLVISALRKKKQIPLVTDQRSVPTSARELAAEIEKILLNRNKPGIYHVINHSTGGVSKYQIGTEILRIMNASSHSSGRLFSRYYLTKSSKKDMFKVARPASPVLINTKLPQMRDWRSSLGEYIRRHVKS